MQLNMPRDKPQGKAEDSGAWHSTVTITMIITGLLISP